MDGSLPGSSVHGIFQERTVQALECPQSLRGLNNPGAGVRRREQGQGGETKEGQGRKQLSGTLMI